MTIHSDALLVQDACNASGIVFSFCRHIDAAGEIDPRHHPAVVLFADKLDDLCRTRRLAALPSRGTFKEEVAKLKQVMDELNEEGRDEGTEWKNHHPKLQERVRTLVYMAGSRDADAYSEAYTACSAAQ